MVRRKAGWIADDQPRVSAADSGSDAAMAANDRAALSCADPRSGHDQRFYGRRLSRDSASRDPRPRSGGSHTRLDLLQVLDQLPLRLDRPRSRDYGVAFARRRDLEVLGDRRMKYGGEVSVTIIGHGPGGTASGCMAERRPGEETRCSSPNEASTSRVRTGR